MSHKMPQVKLSDGFKLPMVGLGTYARKAQPGQYRRAVEWAIELGYRHIDTASSYHNEEEVGEGIASKIKSGEVVRESLFVTTKLWNDRHTKDAVMPALKKLKLDYIDLYLIHWPISVDSEGADAKVDYLETWRGMEECCRAGLARSIGVSNFNQDQLERVLAKCDVKPVCNQIEISPTLTQHELVEWCKQHDIVPVAYTALGLISEARPEFIGKDVIKTDPKLGEIADKYGKSRAQVALRYLIQRGIPVIPKSFTKSRLEENINVFDFELTHEEMRTVESYNINHRCVPATAFANFANYPF